MSIYTSEEIEVPSELPGILKGFAMEVIRYQPEDIGKFGMEYFAAMHENRLEAHLKEIALKKEKEKQEKMNQK